MGNFVALECALPQYCLMISRHYLNASHYNSDPLLKGPNAATPHRHWHCQLQLAATGLDKIAHSVQWILHQYSTRSIRPPFHLAAIRLRRLIRCGSSFPRRLPHSEFERFRVRGVGSAQPRERHERCWAVGALHHHRPPTEPFASAAPRAAS